MKYRQSIKNVIKHYRNPKRTIKNAGIKLIRSGVRSQKSGMATKRAGKTTGSRLIKNIGSAQTSFGKGKTRVGKFMRKNPGKSIAIVAPVLFADEIVGASLSGAVAIKKYKQRQREKNRQKIREIMNK